MRRWRALSLGVAAASVLIVAAGLAWVRVVPSDPAEWHADPLAGVRTGRPNDHLALPPGAEGPTDAISPVFALDPAALMARLDAVALAEPRTRRLAGTPAEGWATYVQRSRLIRWPDYISARAVEAEGGAALAIWSRSRFGYGDMGVNRARVERWLAALQAQDG